jgi:cell division protein FtsL
MSFLAAATVATGALQMFGQYKQGQQAAAAEQFNAEKQMRESESIKQAAAYNKEYHLRQKATTLSTMRANFAFRGVKLSGSPLLVLADTAAMLESDVQDREYQMLIQAQKSQSESRMSEMAARNYRMNGLINAGITGLSTAKSAYNFVPNAPKKLTDTQ